MECCSRGSSYALSLILTFCSLGLASALATYRGRRRSGVAATEGARQGNADNFCALVWHGVPLGERDCDNIDELCEGQHAAGCNDQMLGRLSFIQ